ncbi:Fur-regulated basic protein FbpA [Sporolactobacillus pectinivorans]|uniref:Fur-regulated basic protein FbpA n=1 Tax=Sporolactobacillus pectinivorans TaxID=1591408 RepID=UPI000C25602E|nr:Fur-regulated basic protein FbpA [Sporolactobacillus pectinivorans]
MSALLRQVVEIRRQELIDQLIEADVFKKDGKQLFELTLTELENEYRSLRSRSHF